jgi:hypothetical protein
LLSGCGTGGFLVKNGAAKFSIPFDMPRSQKEGLISKINSVYAGMLKPKLYELFKDFQQETYYKESNEEWITFSSQEIQEPKHTVTFYLKDDKVKDWMQDW